MPRCDYVPDRLVDAVDALVGQVVDDHQFKETVLNEFHLPEAAFHGLLTRMVDKYGAFQPLWDLLPELHRRYQLAIINNGTALTLPLFYDKFGINGKFDAFLSSAIEGIRKPEARIYWRACEKLGVAPSQCLFMDDSEQNVDGARRVGMQAIHWKNHAEGYLLFLRALESRRQTA